MRANTDLQSILLNSYLAFLNKTEQEGLNSDEFVELHLHTEHSVLDGAVRMEDLAKIVKKNGQTAVAVSDHGTMSGVFDAYKYCKKEGIKLIPAIEAYMVEDLKVFPKPKKKKKKSEDEEITEEKDEEESILTSFDRESHIVLLAKNEIGFRNLLQMHFKGYQNKRTNSYGRVIPRLDFEIITQHKEGVIVGTACLGSIFSQYLLGGNDKVAEDWVLKFKGVFGDDFYIEVQPVGLFSTEDEKYSYRIGHIQQLDSLQVKTNKKLIELALKHNILICATSDAHYAKREDRETHALLLAIQSKRDITDENCFYFPAVYMMTAEEMLKVFPAEWIKNTKKIADRCEQPKYLEFGKNYKIPSFPIPKDPEFEEWKRMLRS